MNKPMKSLMGLALVVTQAMLVSACSSEPESAAAAPLKLDVFTADEAGFYVNSTILSGDKEAIVVDAQFTRSQATLLGDRIAKSGKTLTTIYITHAHPDHTFGLEILKKRFPNARVLARPVVVAEMKATGPGKIAQWKPVFKDDLTDTLVDAEPYDADTLTLEGNEIRILGPLQGDAEHMYPVYVPELAAVIAADTAFYRVHPWLADDGLAQRTAWIGALKELAALKPTIVVAGHKKPALADSPEVLTETVAYIEEFDRVVAASKTAEETEQKMLAKYGEFALPIILNISSQSAFPAPAP